MVSFNIYRKFVMRLMPDRNKRKYDEKFNKYASYVYDCLYGFKEFDFDEVEDLMVGLDFNLWVYCFVLAYNLQRYDIAIYVMSKGVNVSYNNKYIRFSGNLEEEKLYMKYKDKIEKKIKFINYEYKS